MNAWLLTWEGTEGPALAPERKIIAILSSRRSSGTIATMVTAFYCRNVESAYDMARNANRRNLSAEQYFHAGGMSSRFFYGRNPCIFARQVVDLKVKRDEAKGIEVISWVEPPVYRNAKVGSGVEEAIAARPCRHERPLTPLASELRHAEA